MRALKGDNLNFRIATRLTPATGLEAGLLLRAAGFCSDGVRPVCLEWGNPLGTLVILTLGVCAVCPLACSLCTNSPVGEYWSPTYVRRLVVFERSCGSTTGFSTQVSLLPASRDWPRGVGNVFVADDDHGSESLGERHTLKLTALWLTEDRVLISYSAKARVFRRQSEVNGVAIQYNPEH